MNVPLMSVLIIVWAYSTVVTCAHARRRPVEGRDEIGFQLACEPQADTCVRLVDRLEA